MSLPAISSLHGHTLGEVAGTVNVLSFAYGYMVCQELEGYAGDEGLEALESVWQDDDVVGELLNLRVTLRHYCRDASSSRAYLLYIADDFIIEVVAGGDDEDWHLAVDESDGAVLHLCCGIAFGMYI